jgi:transposase
MSVYVGIDVHRKRSQVAVIDADGEVRADLLPEAWIAPPPVRQLRTLLRNRIHAIVAEHGYDRPDGGYWTGPGRAWLAALELPAVSRELVEVDLGLIDALQERIDRLDWEIRQRARSGPRDKVLTQLPGVGPFTALVILAEIGEVSRFGSARKLASWAGLTPTVPGSDRVAHYGHISKEGSVWLRWVLCEAAQTAKAAPAVRRQLPGHRQPAGQEDRHHRSRPQAAHPRLAPAHRRRTHRRETPHNASASHSSRGPPGDAVTGPGGGRQARASSKINLSRTTARARRID